MDLTTQHNIHIQIEILCDSLMKDIPHYIPSSNRKNFIPKC